MIYVKSVKATKDSSSRSMAICRCVNFTQCQGYTHRKKHNRFCKECEPRSRKGKYIRPKHKTQKSIVADTGTVPSCADAAGVTVRSITAETPARKCSQARARRLWKCISIWRGSVSPRVRRRGVACPEAKPNIDATRLTERSTMGVAVVVDTKPSTMAATALVASELSPMAVTASTMLGSAVLATELSPMAVTAVGTEISALILPAFNVISIRAELRQMYPMIEEVLGTAIAKMMFRAAGLMLREMGESNDVPIQAQGRQNRRISLLGLLALACGSHGAFATESRSRIDAVAVEMGREKVYTLCNDECVTISSVQQAEWQWFRVWIRSTFPR
jgi:hypothetical protein